VSTIDIRPQAYKFANQPVKLDDFFFYLADVSFLEIAHLFSYANIGQKFLETIESSVKIGFCIFGIMHHTPLSNIGWDHGSHCFEYASDIKGFRRSEIKIGRAHV
jgi:hypothetical protein